MSAEILASTSLDGTGTGIGAVLPSRVKVRPRFNVASTSRGAGEPGGVRSGPALFLGDRERPNYITPAQKVHPHNRVNLDAVAASSSASSDATDGPTGVGASTLLVGGFLGLLALLFCGLLFFAVRLRLIFAFRFLAM
jgi:hypothetical protein